MSKTDERGSRSMFARRLVTYEDAAIAADLEERAARHGHSVAAELRLIVREYLARQERRP
jgi:plasmid stability protein